MPFNYPEIYDTIHDRMTVYMKKPAKKTVVDFSLSAVNAASKRSIINTFRLFEEMTQKGCKLEINWYYQPDDEDVYELGEICQSTFNVKMEIKESKQLNIA
ncbi:MAG: SiaC family regulatory phosphoprotein [Bacteroidales bacterium]|nr:SiaC family regulatory phosphoprotein [Bacteroidales bacterium]